MKSYLAVERLSKFQILAKVRPCTSMSYELLSYEVSKQIKTQPLLNLVQSHHPGSADPLQGEISIPHSHLVCPPVASDPFPSCPIQAMQSTPVPPGPNYLWLIGTAFECSP